MMKCVAHMKKVLAPSLLGVHGLNNLVSALIRG